MKNNNHRVFISISLCPNRPKEIKYRNNKVFQRTQKRTQGKLSASSMSWHPP